VLLEAKADIDARSSEGRTQLHWAARNGHEAIVRLLLEHQADTDVKTTHGRTVLHGATESKHETVVRLLQTPFLKQLM
jgi:ankyrin repeat protein